MTMAAVVVGLVLAASPGHADPIGVVKESGRTAGHSVRDGSLTVGRTVRDFFIHGPRTAKHTWKSNAAQTPRDGAGRQGTSEGRSERVTAPANRVIDADGHVLEPPDVWGRYVEPAWRDRAIRVARAARRPRRAR